MSAKDPSSLYVPGRVKRQREIMLSINQLDLEMSTLAGEITLDIIEGWSTGDLLLDFTLLASDGYYSDKEYQRYRKIQSIALAHAGERILVIQKAVVRDKLIRTFHLAILRKDETLFELNTLSLKIPVETNYFIWRELILPGGDYATQCSLMSDKWLQTGYLLLDDFDLNSAEKKGKVWLVPTHSAAEIVLLSEETSDSLGAKYGINPDELTTLNEQWILKKSTP